MLVHTASGCAATAPHSIPIGIYGSDTRGEEISVSPEEIKFHLKVDERFVDHTYDYTVQANGRIYLSPQVSSDILLGVPKYQWFWDGKAIIQKQPKTGESTKFQKK